MKLTRSSAWKNMAELELYSTDPYQDKAYSRLALFFVYRWRLARAWSYLTERDARSTAAIPLTNGFL
jgi:hypothetical protein